MYRYYLTYIEDNSIQTEEGLVESISDFADDLDDTEIISLDIRKVLDDEECL
jgi:hypothetical protein